MKKAKVALVFLIPLLAMSLTDRVGAGEGQKYLDLHGPTTTVPLAAEGNRAVGDDCTTPIVIPGIPYSDIGQTTCGRGNTYTETCLGSYDGGEDIIYELTVTEEIIVDITMNPVDTWTGLAIDTVCPPGATCLAYDTGSSGIRTIEGLTLTPGTYYIMVDTWPSPTCITSFDLTIVEGEPPPPPPSNPTCETAIDIIAQGLTTWEIDTCQGVDDYSPGAYGNTCTGYSAAGEDIVYSVYLLTGETLTVTVTQTSDGSIYLVTDCSDPETYCVAGADATLSGDPESFSYTATADDTYYLIIDNYSGCGTGTVVIDSPISTKSATWGSVKGLYR
jgi:hypothetical protein